MANKNIKIGFVGAGKMAQALIGAILEGGLVQKQDIICSDVLEKPLEIVHERFSVRITADNREVFNQSDVVVLAIKPQNFPEAVSGLASLVGPEHLIISIMAGVRIDNIRKILPGRVVRVMPNTGCLVGQMAAGFAGGPGVKAKDIELVREILECAGVAMEVSEEQLDGVTGLSGSGPAFVAYLIESFIEAGQGVGLDKKVARQLALKTFRGTTELLSQWDMEPSELIGMVSSPNGTTVAGREILEKSDVSKIIKQTIKRAAQRSKELGG